MKTKAISGIILTLLLISLLTLTFNIQPAEAEPTTWTVDDDGPADFSSIQEAINAATPGDIIQVASGTYYEHMFIEKDSLTLVGEDPSTTIIDTGGFWGFQVESEGNLICGFTIRNGNEGIGLVEGSMDNTIIGNILISNYWDGIFIGKSSGNLIKNNIITSNTLHGIRVLAWSSDNVISGNIVSNNQLGIFLEFTDNSLVVENTVAHNSVVGIYVRENSYDNNIYHNNIVDNNIQAIDEGGSLGNNLWDNSYPSGGNYWSDYIEADLYRGPNQDELGSDGIGDTPYNIPVTVDIQDRYPLMPPFYLYDLKTEISNLDVTAFRNQNSADRQQERLDSQIDFMIKKVDAGEYNVVIRQLVGFQKGIEQLITNPTNIVHKIRLMISLLEALQQTNA